MELQYHKAHVKELAIELMINAQNMYELIAKEFNHGINEHALYGYHSVAYSNYIGLKVYYFQNDILSHHEFDFFFDKFYQFSNEFLSSRETKHSMQWTYGYYNELVEAYNLLADLLEISKFDVPE